MNHQQKIVTFLSSAALLGSLGRMLKHVLDMDTGRFTARDGNLTLYVLRLVIRVEDYVRVLLDLMDAPTAHPSGSTGRLSTHQQMRTVRGERHGGAATCGREGYIRRRASGAGRTPRSGPDGTDAHSEECAMASAERSAGCAYS